MDASGYELIEEGGWEDIAAFSGEVSEALEDADVDGYDGFETWRPKDGEELQDLKDRTVDGESLGGTRMEEESDGPRTEFSRAGKEVRDSGTDFVRGKFNDSAEQAGQAGRSTARGIGPLLAKLLRGLERGIYRHIVEPTNPDYFEAEEVSAAIERCGVRDRRYRCRIIFEEKEALDAVIERMGD